MENSFLCDICGLTFFSWLILHVHRLSHNTSSDVQPTPRREEARPTVIKTCKNGRVEDYLNEDTLNVEELDRAFTNRIVRHFVIHNGGNRELSIFLNNAGQLITTTVQSEQQRLNVIKFGLVLETTFMNVEEELSPRAFIARTRSVNASSDVNQIITECLQELLLKVTEHEGRGSGWTLHSVQRVIIRVTQQGYGDRGSSYIPLPTKLAATKSCINVQNQDNECFKYAMLSKFIRGRHEYRLDRRYTNQMHRYNFNGIQFPVGLTDIKKFENRNPGVSVNVFGVDMKQNVYPLKIVDSELRDHTDLLMLKKDDVSHFVFIKNMNKLLKKQLTKHEHPITACKRCFSFKNMTGVQGKNWLQDHTRLCKSHQAVKLVLPTPNKASLSFNKTSYQYKIPIVVYADFESSLVPIQKADLDDDISYTSPYQLHTPNSYCLLLKSHLPTDLLNDYGLSTEPYVYRGENASKRFIDHLRNIAESVEHLYQRTVPMKDLTGVQQHQLDNAFMCYLCNQGFTENNHKVRDHDHLTGEYRGPACNSCNINYKIPKFVPILMHNLSGYDAHFIVPELGYDDKAIDVIATTSERFISFSKKVGKVKLRFLDSFRFMSSALSQLAENLHMRDLIETSKIVPADKVDLIMRKGVYPYDYIDSIKKFEERSLPPKECFYNKLNATDINTQDYEHAQRVWNELGMTTLGDYSDFYVKLDVTLLTDVMEQFRKTCFTTYGLDPFHTYTAPGLAWQAMLKETKCKIELLTDPDMLLMVESGVRGGLTQCVKKYFKPNNKYLPDYDATKQSSYLAYLDANNLYGWAMTKPLPYCDFKFLPSESIGDITSIPKNGEKGYILECDVSYPETLHDQQYDLPLLPKTDVPPNGKFPKLLPTLSGKEKYVAHYWTLQQAIHLGLRITRIHRVLEFTQSCWLEPYIISNTTRRAAANTAFEKDFFKLMNNAIFGKTLENKRKHKDIKLISDPNKLLKLTKKPNFKSTIVINDNLVAVSMGKTKVLMDRPLYVGMSILDISKTLMYEFHYDKMVNLYGRDRIGVAYMDTDAFLYWILTEDMYEDFRTFEYRDDFDFSDYPRDHPTYDHGANKKVLGKFKDELNGTLLQEYVGLMSKMYALKIYKRDAEDQQDRENNVMKKAKGIKKAYLKKEVTFDHYKQCLFNNTIFKARFNTIRSFNHKVFSITQNKTSLSCYDDKRVILPDAVNTLPHGHYSLNRIDE